ncbi:hypothetical protein C8A03DRAFT_16235 [Achaetomium macrosporum]|uniref:Uncharacterized protein n=1 Tax=Achaetomium macrosporum TaxID=79813 RepID=A0AAN7C950_9PEZI|nr:hypothetical protein C8A03DRAFT_16235 [Achaetomium macrosporum]
MQSSTIQPGQGDETLNDYGLETLDSESVHTPDPQLQTQRTLSDLPSEPQTPPPLMHFPHCRLDITTITASDLPASIRNNLSSSIAPECKFERIALPGSLVRTLLSRFEDEIVHSTTSPQPRAQPQQKPQPRLAAKGRKEVQIQRHFDDGDEWVYSRCLLADYTNFREDEAEVLSAHGRLCCWASVLLRPLAAEGEGGCSNSSNGEGGGSRWELEFVVQRVGVRDPGTGWCECF